jgi:hypothetical protein
MPARLRPLVIYGVPAVLGVLLIFHPLYGPAGIVAALGPNTTWFITLHFLNVLLFPLLGLVLYWLLDGQTGRAASASRLALALFVPVYAAFDAYVGIGTGALVQYAAALPPDQQAIVAPAVDVIWIGTFGNILAAVGSLAWMIALVSAAVALTVPARRLLVAGVGFLVVGAGFGAAGAVNVAGLSPAISWIAIAASAVAVALVARPIVPVVALVLAGLLFATGHIPPFGPAAMLSLLVAAAAHQGVLTRRQPVPTLQPAG